MNGGAGAIEDPDCGKNRMRASGIAPLEWGFNISPDLVLNRCVLHNWGAGRSVDIAHDLRSGVAGAANPFQNPCVSGFSTAVIAIHDRQTGR